VGIGICGLAGDICAEPKNLAKKLTELLRLSRNETKLIELAFDLYTDSAKTSAHTAVERPSPERWVELATERRELIEFLKSFVRRARGPTEVQKDLALAFLEQALRWARSPKKMTEWPNAQSVGSAAQGAALGKLLNQKHWETFWTRPKLDF
ncbi:MAG TPA: hypothetical protein PLH57_12395, partial [Oligoflexia bacterium]|nr:hypothetical protein [Oligoflexia bacterium]